MRVALHTVIAASRKEPLAEMAGRVRKAFLDAGLIEPFIRFTMSDSPGAKASIIDRALKRHPEMNRFLTEKKLPLLTTGRRVLSNAVSGEPIEFSALEPILAGVPRSYPFASIGLHFHVPEFGERLIGLPATGHSYPGLIITDNWWVSGRQRALSAYTVAEASETDKKLPPNPPAVDAVIKACGKAKKAVHVPILAPGGTTLVTSIPRENIEAVKAVTEDFRARIQEVVAAAAMPHTLPPGSEAWAQKQGVLAGPRKPALVAAFKPMGYGCIGGTGEFHLTRRTDRNLTVELSLDVGTWSHSVTAVFLVKGAGFQASLSLPVAANVYGQYPIGDAAQWQKIVENLAAMVRELDRTFVPAVEEAAGPSPAWYQPPS